MSSPKSQRFAASKGGPMMHSDSSVDLVMQPDFVVRVLVPAELNAIHADIRVHDARLRDVLGEDLRQRLRHARLYLTEWLGGCKLHGRSPFGHREI